MVQEAGEQLDPQEAAEQAAWQQYLQAQPMAVAVPGRWERAPVREAGVEDGCGAAEGQAGAWAGGSLHQQAGAAAPWGHDSLYWQQQQAWQQWYHQQQQQQEWQQQQQQDAAVAAAAPGAGEGPATPGASPASGWQAAQANGAARRVSEGHGREEEGKEEHEEEELIEEEHEEEWLEEEGIEEEGEEDWPSGEELDDHAQALLQRLMVQLPPSTPDSAVQPSGGGGALPLPLGRAGAAAAASSSHAAPAQSPAAAQAGPLPPAMQAPAAAPAAAAAAAHGQVCWPCWCRQYAEWRQAYAEWQQHYSEWQRWQYWAQSYQPSQPGAASIGG